MGACDASGWMHSCTMRSKRVDIYLSYFASKRMVDSAAQHFAEAPSLILCFARPHIAPHVDEAATTSETKTTWSAALDTTAGRCIRPAYFGFCLLAAVRCHSVGCLARFVLPLLISPLAMWLLGAPTLAPEPATLTPDLQFHSSAFVLFGPQEGAAAHGGRSDHSQPFRSRQIVRQRPH